MTAPQPIPTYTLFDSTSVGLATFLGTPVAGTGLMALNYHRLGKKNSAIAAFAIGLAVTGLVIAFGSRIPASADTGIAISLLIATRSLAQTLQGAAIEQHVRQGGQMASRWAAAGLGLGLLALIFGGIFLVVLERESSSKVVVGSKDEIRYSGSATKEDARTLGEALKTNGYFRDKGASVLLSKGEDGTVVSFVVKEGIWNQREMVSGFEEIGREIAPSLGGFPIKVRLVNSAQQTGKELAVGKVIIGSKDEIYYFGSATEFDANALGRSLRSAGFFQDRGVTVLLSKDEAGTAVSFVIAEGTWERPDQVKAFEALVRQSAPSVGGLPVQLRLLNSRLETKKVTTVS